MHTQHDQYTHEQLLIIDKDINSQKYDHQNSNHIDNALSKSHMKGLHSTPTLSVEELVYLYTDRDKTKACPQYILVSIANNWCYIKKFVRKQLKSGLYKVKLSKCYHTQPR